MSKKSITSLYTRNKANEGVKFSIPEQPDEWLVIRGLDSDTYRDARADRSRRNLEILEQHQKEKLTPAQLEQLHYEANIDLFAALVADWSFDEECSPENVKAALREAPFLQRLVDTKCGERQSFFENT